MPDVGDYEDSVLTKIKRIGVSRTSESAGSPKLYEISALVCYHVVLRADSKDQAMKHVETWENAWHDSADLVCVSDVDLFDVRDGTEEEAHENIAANDLNQLQETNEGK